MLFTSDLERTLAFYRCIGLPLEVDDHQDDAGPLHYACEIQGVHFALVPGLEDGPARGFRTSGSSFPGFAVKSVGEVVEALRAGGARVIQEPAQYPWGLRAVVQDPDGRAIEVYTPRS
ncbi:MAG: VOC family protein [Acidimicrobiia bacterium]